MAPATYMVCATWSILARSAALQNHAACALSGHATTTPRTKPRTVLLIVVALLPSSVGDPPQQRQDQTSAHHCRAGEYAEGHCRDLGCHARRASSEIVQEIWWRPVAATHDGCKNVSGRRCVVFGLFSAGARPALGTGGRLVEHQRLFVCFLPTKALVSDFRDTRPRPSRMPYLSGTDWDCGCAKRRWPSSESSCCQALSRRPRA